MVGHMTDPNIPTNPSSKGEAVGTHNSQTRNMERLGLDDFIARLEEKFNDELDIADSIAVLKKQRINGRRAKGLKTTDFFTMGIPFGDAMELEEAIRDIESDLQNENLPPLNAQSDALTDGSSSSVYVKETFITKDSGGQSEGGLSNITNIEPNFSSKQSRNDSCDVASNSSNTATTNTHDREPCDTSSDESQDKQPQINNQFDCLKEYFQPSEWKEMSPYDKSAYFNQYKNYQRLKETASESGKSKTTLIKPSFMHKKPSVQQKNKGDCSDSGEKREKEKTMKRKAGEEKEKDCSDSGEKREKEKTMKRKAGEEKENSKSRSVPYVKKKKQNLVHCHGPQDMPEEEYVQTLPEYDVEAVLNDAGEKLEVVRDLLEKNGIVFENKRRLLVRTLTKYLFFESVKDPKEVTQLHKEGLASSICTKWPKFKDECSTRYSWHLLFYRKNNTGFIANCVQTIYRSLDSAQKRRPRKNKLRKSPIASSSGANFDPEKEHRWISLLVANPHNHDEIVDGMKDSFSARRNWITKKSPSITEILRNYTHLMSFRGELINIEFSMMEPGRSSFLLKEFGTLTSKVKKITTLRALNDFDCEGLQVLLTLAELLPLPNVLRRKGRSNERPKALVEDVVTIYAPGTDTKSVIAAKRKAAGKPVQPYILAYVPDRTIKKMFVVCDSDMIEVEGCSFLKGLDLLFKSYYVFNVDYPLGWTFVFQFLQQGIYKIDEDSMSASGKELLKRLSSVQEVQN